MNHPEIVLILARAANGTIGRDGKLPWHLPADLRRFKRLTMGMPMVMGRKTFDSLPGLLDGRRHIVLTRDPAWGENSADEDGAERAGSVAEAIRIANAPHIAVIGGAEIYRAFLPLADRIELTHIAADIAGDTAIDLPDPADWHEIAREEHAAKDGRPAFAFITLVRKPGAET